MNKHHANSKPPKNGSKTGKRAANEMRPEYQLDYDQVRPNRFAGRQGERLVVVLDLDVAQVFTTPEAVNNVLRALITAMPPTTKRKAMAR